MRWTIWNVIDYLYTPPHLENQQVKLSIITFVPGQLKCNELI